MTDIKPFVKESLFFFDIMGLNPRNQTIFAKFRAFFAIYSTGLLTVSILLDIIINWKGTDSLLEGASSVAAYGQVNPYYSLSRKLCNFRFPPPLDVLAQCAIFLFCCSGELFIYCTGGTVINEETSSVANAIYACKWYAKTQPKLRKGVVMIIRRSLQGEQIAVGGMFELNLESFTNVMKTGMSFYTLMNAVYIEE
ncbi:hypothetical protein RI129_010075 [Pyrocoelia pectoralis]|uniref:Uncharacterized protein n=1 Tax=Pyrocoelia pectoralis TaxID=417401 RepID=A0AAN7ZJG8_9COLE